MATIEPSDISCPISYDIMTDPVLAADGQTYERSNITKWIEMHGNSPHNRMLLTINGLTTNYAMKSLIERYNTAIHSNDSSIISKPPIFVNAPLNLQAFIEHQSNDSYLLHSEIIPPAHGDRKPVTFIIGVDISGSMSELACDTSETNGLGFTILDLIKHTMRVMIGMFNENDTFAIVKYNEYATIALKPIRMNDEGKLKAEQVIADLKAGGNTNIFDALRVMNLIAKNPQLAEQNIMTVLLTDGVANISQPRGDIVAYAKLERNELLSTFGFGYKMDSKYLSELATVGGGSFAFIPDYSMIGTVFINFIASLLVTASKNRIMSIKYADGSVSQHNTGLIQFGQNRDFVMTLDKQPVEVSIDGITVKQPEQITLSGKAKFYKVLLENLKNCIANNLANNFLAFYNEFKDHNDPIIKAIIRDFKPFDVHDDEDEGQLSMAPRTPLFWDKWGKHYVRAYFSAHIFQVCMNFKDYGLQIYGGELFHQMQDLGEAIFNALPALKPTGRIPATTTTTTTATGAAMSQVFYNSSGGCWAPGSKVRMYDDSFMAIDAIRSGMKVLTKDGIATVEYTIALGTNMPTQSMCKINNLIITPWHPVLIDDKWTHPIAITTVEEMVMPIVYNMILDKNHIIEIDGILSCTLGHGITGCIPASEDAASDGIVKHDYFGNKELIIRDLMKQPGFDEKCPIFKNIKAIRDPITKEVTGWYDDI